MILSLTLYPMALGSVQYNNKYISSVYKCNTHRACKIENSEIDEESRPKLCDIQCSENVVILEDNKSRVSGRIQTRLHRQLSRCLAMLRTQN